MTNHTHEIIVVANRLPVSRAGRDRAWRTSPGGLVSALMPILQRAGDEVGAWIGWTGTPSGQSDPAAFVHEGVRNIPVALNAEQIAGYYDGMSNSTLWPLYHDVIRPPSYQRAWWRHYQDVNTLFAEAAAAHAAPNAFVWIHDYHLHLVPGILRRLRPDLRIGFFLHIPFPDGGLFSQLPWRSQIIRQTLGADVVGFQTPQAGRNFTELARRLVGAEPTEHGLMFDDRRIAVEAFPVSIDARKFEQVARDPKVIARAAEFRSRLGGRTVLLGVDRMDYTKGIDIRLRAFQELLRLGKTTLDRTVLVQSGVPTRERGADYAELRSCVEQLVGEINGQFGQIGRAAVHYLRRTLDLRELVALYLAGDVMLVTPLSDGMNLVAKEYVTTRTDDSGVLILSEFAGASLELNQALLINPRDLDGVTAAMDQALRMEPAEKARRMRAMRATVTAHDVYDWAQSFMNRLSDTEPHAAHTH